MIKENLKAPKVIISGDCRPYSVQKQRIGIGSSVTLFAALFDFHLVLWFHSFYLVNPIRELRSQWGQWDLNTGGKGVQ